MKAAFVAVSGKADDKDLAKAREWWDQAASLDEVNDLITAVNDDYSLRQDVAKASVDAAAMEKLTGRIDRLKGSTKLDDYAGEYQAAIQESLDKLEPETELIVGASTTVKILELKSDRILLEVADVKRGFRYEDLPLGLASAIAQQTLPRDVPLTMVMKGAYYAARDRESGKKQFRDLVLTWWKEAGEMDSQLQPVIQELVKQYPE